MRLWIPKAGAAGVKRVLRCSRRVRTLLQLALLLSGCVLVACSSQPSILAMIFDIPPPGQDSGDALVNRNPRRVPYVDPSIQARKDHLALIEEAAKEKPVTNWAEVFKKLPKDDDDNIDWTAAWKDKLIQPSAGIDPDTPVSKMMDDDVELATSGKPARMVVFSHAVHTQWLSCANCHPAIFQKDAGSAKITMDAMDEGQYCGVCHDKVAIAQPYGCKGCHKVKKKT